MCACVCVYVCQVCIAAGAAIFASVQNLITQRASHAGAVEQEGSVAAALIPPANTTGAAKKGRKAAVRGPARLVSAAVASGSRVVEHTQQPQMQLDDKASKKKDSKTAGESMVGITIAASVAGEGKTSLLALFQSRPCRPIASAVFEVPLFCNVDKTYWQ